VIGDWVRDRRNTVTKPVEQVGAKPRLQFGAVRRRPCGSTTNPLRISPIVTALRNSVATGCALSQCTTRGSGRSRPTPTGRWCPADSRSQVDGPSGRRAASEIRIEAPQRRKEFGDVFRGLRAGQRPSWRRSMERLEDYIFSVSERPSAASTMGARRRSGWGAIRLQNRSNPGVPVRKASRAFVGRTQGGVPRQRAAPP
jgi:hypothetical protein